MVKPMNAALRPAAAIDPLLDARQVSRAIGLGKQAILRMADCGDFPKPLVLVREKSGKPRKYGWLSSEIKAWVASRERG